MGKDLFNSEPHVTKNTLCCFLGRRDAGALLCAKPQMFSPLGGKRLFRRKDVACDVRTMWRTAEPFPRARRNWKRVKVSHDRAVGQPFNLNCGKQLARAMRHGTAQRKVGAPAPASAPHSRAVRKEIF
ncbi:MAG: hypothetical protein DBX55_06155 [Verrucomicrobia bacterium]|nr:MAG: hypothetical protein DBX55_06155 [Verrucomicrobiota bacterium]